MATDTQSRLPENPAANVKVSNNGERHIEELGACFQNPQNPTRMAVSRKSYKHNEWMCEWMLIPLYVIWSGDYQL